MQRRIALTMPTRAAMGDAGIAWLMALLAREAPTPRGSRRLPR